MDRIVASPQNSLHSFSSVLSEKAGTRLYTPLASLISCVHRMLRGHSKSSFGCHVPVRVKILTETHNLRSSSHRRLFAHISGD